LQWVWRADGRSPHTAAALSLASSVSICVGWSTVVHRPPPLLHLARRSLGNRRKSVNVSVLRTAQLLDCLTSVLTFVCNACRTEASPFGACSNESATAARALLSSRAHKDLRSPTRAQDYYATENNEAMLRCTMTASADLHGSLRLLLTRLDATRTHLRKDCDANVNESDHHSSCDVCACQIIGVQILT
jgi:hypothetical protein